MKQILLQAPASDSGNILTFLIIVAVCIGLFVVFRSIMLWYWRVDEIVKQQQMQTMLLSKILKRLEAANDDKTKAP